MKLKPNLHVVGLILLLIGCRSEPQAPASAPSAPEPTGQASDQDPFLEITAATGLDFVHFNGMSGGYHYSEMMGSGGALFDADNDGDLDLFLVQGTLLGNADLGQAVFQPANMPVGDRLYLNLLDSQGSIRFRVAENALPADDGRGDDGKTGDGYGMGVAAADFNNDGWIDLYVTQTGANRLLQHRGLDDQGRPRFEDVTDRVSGLTRWGVPAVPFDADGDGDTDLFVGNYVTHSPATEKRCPDELGRPNYCGPLAYPPQPDNLLINVGEPGGEIRFEDRSSAAGLGQAFGACLGAVAADFNGDHLLDIYVANDGNPNQLWINQGNARFKNMALESGAGVNGQGHSEASMGVAAWDVDGDLDEDVFLTHLARETHTLYLNDGLGGFMDGSAASGLAAPSVDRTGFGTAFLDFDHDGLMDLVVAAGAVKVIKEQALQGDPHPLKQRNQLYRGVAPGKFEDVTNDAGPAFAHLEVSRGTLVGDLDNDGDPDLILTQNAGPARVLLNQHGQNGPWLGLRLVSAAGSDIYGAQARMRWSDGRTTVARVGGNAGYASANDPRLSISPGTEQIRAAEVSVLWPDGLRESWLDVPLGTYTALVRGQGKAEPSSHPPT